MTAKPQTMSFQITFEKFPTYLHATVTGKNSREVVTQYMTRLTQECIKSDCFRVLIEERLEGPRLPAMEVFSVASEGSMKALGQFEAIAYVDESMGEMAEFAETVAVNRGLPIATFDNVEEARRWLLGRKSGSDEQYIFWDPDNPN